MKENASLTKFIHFYIIFISDYLSSAKNKLASNFYSFYKFISKFIKCIQFIN